MTEFRSRWDEIQAANLGLYGISVDSVFSHHAFAEQLGGLPFELLADFERTVVEAYGVMRTDVAGYHGMPMRSIFVIDRQNVIRWTWKRSHEQPLPDYDVVLERAREVV